MKVSAGNLTHSRKGTYIHTYIHAYIHTRIHTYIHTYIHAYIRISVWHILYCRQSVEERTRASCTHCTLSKAKARVHTRVHHHRSTQNKVSWSGVHGYGTRGSSADVWWDYAGIWWGGGHWNLVVLKLIANIIWGSSSPDAEANATSSNAMQHVQRQQTRQTYDISHTPLAQNDSSLSCSCTVALWPWPNANHYSHILWLWDVFEVARFATHMSRMRGHTHRILSHRLWSHSSSFKFSGKLASPETLLILWSACGGSVWLSCGRNNYPSMLWRLLPCTHANSHRNQTAYMSISKRSFSMLAHESRWLLYKSLTALHHSCDYSDCTQTGQHE